MLPKVFFKTGALFQTAKLKHEINSYYVPTVGYVFQPRTDSWQEQILHVCPLHLCQ